MALATTANDQGTPEAGGTPESLTVRDLIMDLADTAKLVNKTFGIPINSSVELVKLGIGYHMSTRSYPVPTPENLDDLVDDAESDVDADSESNVTQFPTSQE